MLYHLLVPLAKDHILFNVFRYLTFRSVMALISALVISLLIGPPLIQKLKEWQHGGETIREDTPERHRAKKGTPTMGGLVILAALIGSTLLWANLRNRYVWVVVLATAGFGLIGFWDDARKVKKRKGLTARTKFLMQLLLALGVLQIILWQPAANGWTPLLPIPFLKGAGELTVFWRALIGAAIGFLWFNCHPAQVFMGDVGSLALGGAIGTLAVVTKAELLLPLIGGLYVVEAVSVIIQVASFKLTGR